MSFAVKHRQSTFIALKTKRQVRGTVYKISFRQNVISVIITLDISYILSFCSLNISSLKHKYIFYNKSTTRSIIAPNQPIKYTLIGSNLTDFFLIVLWQRIGKFGNKKSTIVLLFIALAEFQSDISAWPYRRRNLLVLGLCYSDSHLTHWAIIISTMVSLHQDNYTRNLKKI